MLNLSESQNEIANKYEGIRMSLNVCKRPSYLTPEFNREMNRIVNPTGEISKLVAMLRVIQLRSKFDA